MQKESELSIEELMKKYYSEPPGEDDGEDVEKGKGEGETRYVRIPGLESISESDFHHFSEIDDSDSDSNASKNRFLWYCSERGVWSFARF